MELMKKNWRRVYGRDINYRFATAEEYYNDVHKLNATFPVYNGDFIPFLDNENFWTGYYSNIPSNK